MATELATAYLSLVPSMKGVQGSIAKEFAPSAAIAQRSGADAGKKFGGGISAGVKGIAATLGAVFVADKVVGFFKDSIAEAREAQKVGALTESIIKATGGAAQITADQVGALAGSISKKAGIDDEAIQSGANLLLTFKNVKNEVGDGANVFDRATAAAVDLSAVGFGDINSASKMLGKALNDPIKGITALSRAGVTFTEGQKSQIEAMVKSGDVLGAQKLIMAEVESQVGGAAEAASTAGEKMARSWGDFQETVGTALIPLLDSLMEKGTAAFDWASENPEAIKNMAIAIGAIAASVVAYKTAVIGFKAVQGAIAAATAVWTAAQWLLNIALNANPIGLIVIAIAAVVGVIALLWTKCDWFRNGVMAIWNGIKIAVGAVVEWFQTSVLPILTNVWNWIKTGVGFLWTAFSTYWGLILGAVRTVIEWIVANVWPKAKAAFDLFKSGVETVWRIVSTNFTNMRNIIGTVMEWVRNHIDSKIAAVREIFNTLHDKIGDVIGWFRGIKDKIAGALSGVGDKILAPFKSAFNAIANAWNNTVGKLNFTFPEGIPGVGGKGVSVPKIPTLAEGATIKPRRGGTLAILAEAGRSESVVDTGLMNQRLSEMNMTRHLAAAMAAAPAPSATPTTLVVVDQDGQLIGRMRVEAGVAMDSLADELIYRNAG